LTEQDRKTIITAMQILSSVSESGLGTPEALHALTKSLGVPEKFPIYEAVERLFDRRV
jgi:hypothetical protein